MRGKFSGLAPSACEAPLPRALSREARSAHDAMQQACQSSGLAIAPVAEAGDRIQGGFCAENAPHPIIHWAANAYGLRMLDS